MISWVFIIFMGDYIHFIIWHQERAVPSQVCWAHHHGCHSSHQIWTLPIVPLDTIVANYTGWAGVIYTIQVGWTASLKPPTWRGNMPESSRKKSELIEFKLMKCNTQMCSCKSAVTLLVQRENEMHFRAFTRGWVEMFNKMGYTERQIETGVDE